MEQAMKRGGYMRVQSTMERKVDDKRRDVDVIVKMQPGPHYTFGKLAIQGLDIQTEPHIRKLWTMKAGQSFNVDYPEYFLARIRSDGVMDNLGDTKVDIKLDDKAHVADVTLIFKPAPRPVQTPRIP